MVKCVRSSKRLVQIKWSRIVVGCCIVADRRRHHVVALIAPAFDCVLLFVLSFVLTMAMEFFLAVYSLSGNLSECPVGCWLTPKRKIQFYVGIVHSIHRSSCSHREDDTQAPSKPKAYQFLLKLLVPWVGSPQ